MRIAASNKTKSIIAEQLAEEKRLEELEWKQWAEWRKEEDER